MLMEQIVSFVEDEDEGNDLSTWLFLFKTVYPFFSGLSLFKLLNYFNLEISNNFWNIEGVTH